MTNAHLNKHKTTFVLAQICYKLFALILNVTVRGYQVGLGSFFDKFNEFFFRRKTETLEKVERKMFEIC